MAHSKEANDRKFHRKKAEAEQRRRERAWARDQNDPDNWAVIPEFGVDPASVAFEGFRQPLVFPGTKDPSVADSLRNMLRIGRKCIREQFASYAAVNAAAFAAWDLEPDQWTAKQRSAFAFRLMEISVLNAVDYSTPERFRPGHIASAGSVLAALLSDDIVSMVTKIGRTGGVRSGEARREKGIDRVAVREAARTLGWPELRYGVQKKLSTQFNCTASHIGDILREK